ncbi:hypothetical protein E2C01_021429 [Portunus trituberculatus]|uniref:Uncharacterized protein n=1 Tax=Portunus trituberculatus TaxID=210409 RepID=A0A5B7E2I1_PORTR|nr:hypothetical protein [Portunus trituberculatus]
MAESELKWERYSYYHHYSFFYILTLTCLRSPTPNYSPPLPGTHPPPPNTEPDPATHQPPPAITSYRLPTPITTSNHHHQSGCLVCREADHTTHLYHTGPVHTLKGLMLLVFSYLLSGDQCPSRFIYRPKCGDPAVGETRCIILKVLDAGRCDSETHRV